MLISTDQTAAKRTRMMAKVSFDQSRPFPSKGLRFILTVLLTTAVLAPMFGIPVLAQNGGPYALKWWSVDGGYSVSRGGDYTLGGTVGQPEAGAGLTGGRYTVFGGICGGGALASEEEVEVFLPLVLRGHGSR
jgi:hypothetical protein